MLLSGMNIADGKPPHPKKKATIPGTGQCLPSIKKIIVLKRTGNSGGQNKHHIIQPNSALHSKQLPELRGRKTKSWPIQQLGFITKSCLYIIHTAINNITTYSMTRFHFSSQ